jgi:hypothetical protein
LVSLLFCSVATLFCCSSKKQAQLKAEVQIANESVYV